MSRVRGMKRGPDETGQRDEEQAVDDGQKEQGIHDLDQSVIAVVFVGLLGQISSGRPKGVDRDEQQVLEQEKQRETGNRRNAQTVDVELKENGKYAAEEGDGNEPSLLSGQFPDDRPVDPERRPVDGFSAEHQDLMGVDE